ncbi:MAG: hypothetical protein PUP93_01260 [Rhizonema sp. NSF051]|nr:hypothetical protein [Rhizonema sp. NSF051]
MSATTLVRASIVITILRAIAERHWKGRFVLQSRASQLSVQDYTKKAARSLWY